MIIGFVDKCSNTLLRELDAAGIKYKAHTPEFIVIIKCNEAVQIAKVAIPAVVPVVSAWLQQHSARRALLTMRNNTIEPLEGKTLEDMKRLFVTAKNMVIMETQQSDSESLWQHQKSLTPTTAGCFSYVAMAHDDER
jgi:hypothetical protein